MSLKHRILLLWLISQPAWCGPCQQIKPKFKQFAKEYNAEFLQVDVDEFEKVAQEAKVTAMPTFHFYANGKKVAESVGADERDSSVN